MQTGLNRMLVIVVWLPSHDTWQFVQPPAPDNLYQATFMCVHQLPQHA